MTSLDSPVALLTHRLILSTRSTRSPDSWISTGRFSGLLGSLPESEERKIQHPAGSGSTQNLKTSENIPNSPHPLPLPTLLRRIQRATARRPRDSPSLQLEQTWGKRTPSDRPPPTESSQVTGYHWLRELAAIQLVWVLPESLPLDAKFHVP